MLPGEAQAIRSPADDGSEANQLMFVIKSMLASTRTNMLVKVLAVTNDGGVSPVGFVDIQPMVSQVAGDGTVFDHATIYGVPYLRVQGGSNAVILDPEVGDIGIAVICDRDISAVKASGDVAPPGSRRRFDMSDAVYLYTVIGQAPTQYTQFSPAGITITSPVKVTVNAPDVEINSTTATVNTDSAVVMAGTVQVTASTSVEVDTPLLTFNAAMSIFNGTVTVNGATLFNGPIAQTPGSQGAGAVVLDGPVMVMGDVVAGGKSLVSHTHTSAGSGSPTSPPI